MIGVQKLHNFNKDVAENKPQTRAEGRKPTEMKTSEKGWSYLAILDIANNLNRETGISYLFEYSIKSGGDGRRQEVGGRK